MAQMAEDYHVDPVELGRNKFMDWGDLRELAADPLVTIGAHSVNHYALAKLPEAEARAEMAKSAEIIGEKLGQAPAHFAYPYGDPDSAGAREFRIAAELGFRSAVTTRKGVIHGEHRGHMTALPRISLNGDYQSLRYLDLFLTGVPFLLWNRFRRLDVA
jgi:peptidoglycan/xylan/chitin deacetylase (PgdA/CDA1 family)